MLCMTFQVMFPSVIFAENFGMEIKKASEGTLYLLDKGNSLKLHPQDEVAIGIIKSGANYGIEAVEIAGFGRSFN